MRRPTRAKMGQNDSNNNPDFYRLNLIAPLPNNDSMAGNPGPTAGITTPSVGNEFLSLSGLQNNSNTTEQVGYNPSSGGGMDSSINANALLSQNFQGGLPQNFGALGQLSGFNPSLQGMGGGIGNIAGGTNADIHQLDALRQRKDDLMRQLHGLQSTQNMMNTLQSLQTGHSPSSQLGAGGNQFQQMMNIPNNISSQMGGLLNGSQQMNVGGLTGNTPAQSGALNQQLLMQQSLMGTNGNLGNIGMANNNMLGSEFNQFNALM